ncbi:MAG: archease [Thermoplasmata archaeon HGW-Thermoplasmata-1]|nr:MAG: archease [Thermoplasmata archaeon HGW-Thermoplasmata-1]
MSSGYSLITHTADVGLEAWGPSLSDAFAQAARGMFDIITDSSKIAPAVKREFSLAAENPEELLVDFLNRLLFYNGAEFLVFGRFDIDVDADGRSLQASVWGEEYDRSRHGYGAEIKAVTYHLLNVCKPLNGKNAKVSVLFDV